MASENHNQENQTNSLREHHMESAIETVLSNKEQSYEDFMGCFMALKKEDVLARQTHMKQKTLNQKEENQTSEGQRSKVEMDAPEDPKPIRQDNVEEEIEIEELEEGHYAPVCSSTDVYSGHKFVQMDNFVDDADLCEDDSEGGENGDEQFAVSHYESSFGLVDNSSTSPLNLSKDIIARIEGRKEGEENSSVDHLELRRGCEMRTLPGEADEEEERDVRSSSLSDDTIHKTELKMSTRRNQELEDTEETLKPKMNLEISTDEVQPFTLDKDFDYDNVVLTPKWDSNHQPPGWMPGD